MKGESGLPGMGRHFCVTVYMSEKLDVAVVLFVACDLANHVCCFWLSLLQ